MPNNETGHFTFDWHQSKRDICRPHATTNPQPIKSNAIPYHAWLVFQYSGLMKVLCSSGNATLRVIKPKTIKATNP